jgi:hypothetical protein
VSFSLSIVGHGVEARLRLPIGVAWTGDNLLLGPMNLELARAQNAAGGIRNGVLVPGKREVAVAGVAQERDLVEWIGSCFDCEDHWALRTDDYELALPRGWTLRVDGAGEWPWELALGGSSDDLIYLRGPVPMSRIPPPNKAAGPGMSLWEQGTDPYAWFELAYHVVDTPFRQRSYTIPLDDDAAYLLTAQSAESAHAQMIEAAELVASSFVVLED